MKNLGLFFSAAREKFLNYFKSRLFHKNNLDKIPTSEPTSELAKGPREKKKLLKKYITL